MNSKNYTFFLNFKKKEKKVPKNILFFSYFLNSEKKNLKYNERTALIENVQSVFTRLTTRVLIIATH